MDQPIPLAGVTFPALLRHARTTYGAAMRRALDAAGYDDIPGNGLYLIGGLALGQGPAYEDSVPLGDLIRALRISKQSAGLLVDTLVTRGYLDRTTAPDDRRKLTIALTPRGQAAAEIQFTARQQIDTELARRVGQPDIDAARRTLAALIHIERETAQATSPTTNDDAEP